MRLGVVAGLGELRGPGARDWFCTPPSALWRAMPTPNGPGVRLHIRPSWLGGGEARAQDRRNESRNIDGSTLDSHTRLLMVFLRLRPGQAVVEVLDWTLSIAAAQPSGCGSFSDCAPVGRRW